MTTNVRSSKEGLNIVTYTGNGGNQLIGPNANKGIPSSLIANPITQSIRFRPGATAYLNRTPGSAGDRKTWTWSGWVKRSDFGANHFLIGASAASDADYTGAYITSSNVLRVFSAIGGVNKLDYSTQLVFGSVDLWMHIVIAIDALNSLFRIYVNGRLASLTTVVAVSNINYYINHTVSHRMGRDVRATATISYFDGYMTNIALVDGQYLTASDFGYADAVTGQWMPLDSTTIRTNVGSWGTNGFFLMMNDTPSNVQVYDRKTSDATTGGTNWACNGISIAADATYDWMEDSPTNNFCTLNSIWISLGTVSNAGLRVVTGNLVGTAAACLGTIQIPHTGKWYWESTVVSRSGDTTYWAPVAGISTDLLLTTSSCALYDKSTRANTSILINGAVAQEITSYVGPFAQSTIGICVDADNKTIEFFVNNVSKVIVLFDMTNKPHYPLLSDGSSTQSITWDVNFGQRAFTYTPPTGFVALCSQNLPSMDTHAYNADLIIIKNRDSAQNWAWVTQMYGLMNVLSSNLTAAAVVEYDVTQEYYRRGCVLLGNDTKVNTLNQDYVAYLFSAGNNPVSNTDGTITSTVTANKRTGISVVAYTGNGTNGATVGHGLGVAPGFIIVKTMSGVNNWAVYHKELTAANMLLLNSTNPQGLISTYNSGGISTTMGINTFTCVSGPIDLGHTNTNTHLYIAYCFAEVPGFSKIGTYTGNGAADGPFVYCGFRPALVLIKDIQAASAENWLILDNARNTYNPVSQRLYLNATTVEDSSGLFDFLSNGFKCRNGGAPTSNQSGHKYTFMAFAEAPFGDHFVSPSTAR